MASQLTWLDYSDRERRQALEVIDLFHETETRDELGIGSVRDAFADLMFPGTSTIQTRARYFFFIPWIFRELETKRMSQGEVRLRLRKAEVALMNELAEADDTRGVIGKQSRDTLKRLPSSVYWAGLRTWGIRKFPGSLEEYFRVLASGVAHARRTSRRDDGELLDDAGAETWHANLPSPPDGFPYDATFELTQDEASYLTDRVRSHATGTMLAFLLDRGNPADCAFVWEHPQRLECSDIIQEQITNAENFSLVMHGAALFYNLLLAEKRVWEEMIEDYRERLDVWWTELNEYSDQLARWERERFWTIARESNSRIPKNTEAFVDRWLDISSGRRSIGDIIDSKDAQALISEREFKLKRGRARLRDPRALENWKGDAGTARLDYRWRSARNVIDDVLKPHER